MLGLKHQVISAMKILEQQDYLTVYVQIRIANNDHAKVEKEE